LTFQTFQDFLLGLPGCSPQQIAAGCSPATPAPGTNGTSLSNISNSGNFSTLGGPKGPAFVNFLQSASDVFMQDDIKLAPKVTANLGLRWDFDAPVTSQSGELGNVWPSLVHARYRDLGWVCGAFELPTGGESCTPCGWALCERSQIRNEEQCSSS
jgi:hypothetical protein